MHFLTNAAYRLPAVNKTVNNIMYGSSPTVLFGLPDVAKAVFLSCLYEKTEQNIFVLTETEAVASRLAKDMEALGRKTVIVPARDYILENENGYSREYEHKRITALYRIATDDYDIAFADIESFTEMTVSKSTLLNSAFVVKNGDTVNLEKMRERLINIGYVFTEQVDGPGQFSVRGGIIDIYSTAHDKPIRVELWGDDVDLISYFDIENQRRTDNIDSFTVLPASEFTYDKNELLSSLSKYASKKGLSDGHLRKIRNDVSLLESGESVCADRYLALLKNQPVLIDDYIETSIFTVCESKNITARLKSLTASRTSDLLSLTENGIISKTLDKFYAPKGFIGGIIKSHNSVYVDNFNHGGFAVPPLSVETATIKQISPHSGSIDLICDDIRPVTYKHGTAVISVSSGKISRIMAEELTVNNISVMQCKPESTFGSGVFITVCEPLSSGIEMPEIGVVYLSYRTAVPKKHKLQKRSKNEIFNSLDELKIGDYVVHTAHGIGQFDGIRRIRTGDITKDYIKIKYRGSDVLYVPVTQLDMVSRYIGNNSENGPQLHRLGGTEWQKTRSRVRTAVTDMAKELTALYAKRMAQSGFAFSEDNDLQNDFERRFPYDETDDQLRSINDIKKDMERDVPMDRLLCGDVGFGKTEVALRAAFKCICDGKQCALLVPTTILAWQHFLTAKERIGNLPVKVELLSRFKTPTEIKNIIKRIKTGDVDIVIGTHRLISKDVQFRDLGLVIIDEEQRFGVAQKEKLKSLFPTVDVLTLTATPIPRTLNMAMSGIRDMSSIEEAPQDRQPVQTYVCEQNNGMLTEAVSKELRRGGQVYYLHNRVDSIERCATKLMQALPDASIGVAHGRMGEEELSEVWRKLLEHEIDVLVCTTIIETGVDVPNVNTLIIEDADRMGLSQLHQLRGRVGRSARRAYAYFCFRPGKALSEIAEKRLEAIREYTEFGSGFKIAMRDLEIRGAGSILGGEQHGHMEAVGYDMYIKMLNDAVDEQRGIKKSEAPDCAVDLSINANIPERYIPALSHRLEMYRRIADIKTTADRDDVIDELCDRFGEPPKEVMGLMDISLLRNAAAANGINEITGDSKSVNMYIRDIMSGSIPSVMKKLGSVARLMTAEKPYYKIDIPIGRQPVDILKGIAKILADN